MQQAESNPKPNPNPNLNPQTTFYKINKYS